MDGNARHTVEVEKQRRGEVEDRLARAEEARDRYKRRLEELEGDFGDHNFGKGAELLFTPCEIPDDEYEELLLPAPQAAVESPR